MNPTRSIATLMLGLVLTIVLAAVGWSVFASGVVPDGPVDLVWDKAACACCSMHVGEPPFAAQLTTAAGETLAFDDPGCLFLYVAEQRPQVHAIWFRHLREHRWLSEHAVAFAEVEPTPMGFGLGAVDPGTKGAIGLEVARARCLERLRGGGR